MKRTFFSKLLAGALLVAAVSSFVSCKDYDDDINDLRNQISAKSSELSKDLNDKIQTVTNTIAGLQSQVSEMDKAYKASDAALQTLISTTASGTLAEAKSYADNKASETLASAKAAAESYAEIQAAQAQAAAIAAAKEALAQAQAELNAALAEANATIASQGTTITALLEADKVLTTAISAAQAKADAAYALADQANKLAETNKANIEKNADAIAALQQELTNLKGSAAEIQTVVKLQSDLEAMTAKLNETAASLETTKITLASVQTDLATLKQSLETQTKILGEKIADVLTIANNNTTDIQAAKTQLTELKNSNEKAIEAINATIANLDATVAGNKEDVTKALNALKTLIQENKTAIETLLDTKIADLQKLIGANADEIAANKLAADKAIGENAAAILKNAGDITTIANAVKALQEAFGKETAATLKAYAESAASTAAQGAKDYADAQDAAAKIAILEAVLALNYQNKEAVEAAINTAVETLVKTYNLATLYETILAGDNDAKDYADKVAAQALADAKHWADDVRTYLDQNFTNTQSMQKQIEDAKNSAIAIAYTKVIEALLHGTDKEVPTIAQEVKKQVEAFVAATTYTKDEADEMVGDAIEAALKAAMTPSEPAEMGKPAVQAGLIMAAIEAAAEKAASDLETYKQEQALVDEAQDIRLKDIEDFLNNTLEDKSFNGAVAALIADDQNVKTLQANYAQLSGELASLTSFVQGEDGIASILAELKANHEQLYADVANISATIKNINALFAPTASARRAAEEAGGAGLVVATEEPVIDEQDLATFFNVIKGLIENQKNNEELAATVKGEAIAAVNASLGAEMKQMLTSVTLIPQLYIGGIEAIEFKTLVYYPRNEYTGAQDIYENNVAVNVKNVAGAAQKRIDNKMTKAYYRLSPNTVDEESFDINNLSFVSNVAEVRYEYDTRATVGPEAKSLVSVSKAEYKKNDVDKGHNVLTVYLKKNDSQTRLDKDLNYDQIRTVALRVPRTAKYGEENMKDVFSEYSRITEIEFTPRIAALPFDKKHYNFGWKQHYSDFNAIYNTLIDADDRVTKEVYYKDELDLLTLVTGDYEDGYNSMYHQEITKEQLKEYGLAFRFYIPSKAYNDVTHKTDQQQFAKLSNGNGGTTNIITSKLPNGVVDNEAAVGKEPIVCVQLKDTVNNLLVDQRYLKIKWVSKKLAAVQLDPYSKDFTLSCDDQTYALTWTDVINNIYGKIKDEDGNVVGMSQSRFEQNYPIANMTWDAVNDDLYKDDVKKYAGGKTSEIALGTKADGLSPISSNTTNENGDAIIVAWTISTDEIGTLGSNGRSFKVKINFKSSDPERYPDLYFYWTANYKLPAYKAYVAKNTINWATDDQTIMWIYPVQYGTSTASAKVKYEYNLMASFTRPAEGKNLWVVRDLLGNCPAWDMQFSTTDQQDKLNALGKPLSQYDVAYHRAHNTWAQPLKPYSWLDSQISPIGKPTYSYDEVQGVGTTTDQATESAYLFYNENGAQVLNIEWGGSHPSDSWAGEKGTTAATPATATLKAVNNVVYPLLNQLDDDNEADKITPKKTHTKLVKMNAWAKLNQWNYYEVNNSPFYLAFVEPLRVNASLDDYFVDNIAGGSRIGVAEGLTMTDFAGYYVRKVAYSAKEIADAPKVGTKESSKKWAAELYKYYGIKSITWMTSEVRYGLKLDAGQNLIADNSINVSNAVNGKTASWVENTTTGGVNPSVTYDSATDELVFLNLGGQHVGFDYNVFVPVDVTYELGTIRRYVKIVVHPAGYGSRRSR